MLTLPHWPVLWTSLHLLIAPQSGLLSSAQLQPGAGTSWHQYVRAPPSRNVAARAVLASYTSGNVTNPEALLGGSGGGVTLLTRQGGSAEVPTVVVDFGQNVVGLLTIAFAGSSVSAGDDGSGGTRPGLKLSFSETLQYLGDRSDFTRSDNARTAETKLVPSGTDQVAVQAQPYSWIDQWGCQNGNQVCSDGLHGFRYVKIQLDALASDAPYTTSSGSVAISSVGLQWSGYLGTSDTFTGYFECSDPDLTQWWYDGAYTTETNIDVFRANDTELRDATSASLLGKVVMHDGAKRDRDPYMGDVAVSGLTSYLTHDIPQAARNVMDDLALHQRSDGWIPPASINNYGLSLFDYPLWWVSSSWEHVFYTGNLSYINTHYAKMVLLLDTYYPSHTAADTGLLLRPADYGDYAFLQRPGSAAYYSALYVLALTRAASLADQLSRSADAQRWRERAAAVSQSFIDQLWDPSVGAFLDRRCTGKGCSAHAQDGNSLAILAGIIAGNSSQAASLLTYLRQNNARPYGNTFYDAGGDLLPGCERCADRVYAFISYFEIAARFEAGRPAEALEQTRRMYGWMASHDPGVTFWEGIGPNGSLYEGPFTSMSHGWSSGVVPLLSNYVLGVKPEAPGFVKWSVRPQAGGLGWARGVVPGLEGPLGVSWVVDQRSGNIKICVDAPRNTSGVVGVRAHEFQGKKVVVNGKHVWDGTNEGRSESGAVVVDGWVEYSVEGEGLDHCGLW